MKGQERWLLLCGSLRPGSSARAVLNEAARMLPPEVEVEWYEGLGRLPAFDDLQYHHPEVQYWRQALQETQALFICTPEYAFGVPGALKNALDWTVGSSEMVNKPVGLITASSQGRRGHAAMLDILTALSCNIHKDTSLLISFVRAKLDEGGHLKDEATLNAMRILIQTLLKRSRKMPAGS